MVGQALEADVDDDRQHVARRNQRRRRRKGEGLHGRCRGLQQVAVQEGLVHPGPGADDGGAQQGIQQGVADVAFGTVVVQAEQIPVIDDQQKAGQAQGEGQGDQIIMDQQIQRRPDARNHGDQQQ